MSSCQLCSVNAILQTRLLPGVDICTLVI
uniref:Uncharacterized protein n=1 Tax=Arundo donax TaxID=35708 RepID=A0A0A8YKZ6_ARUDO